jgi:hypothetical protein
MPLVYDTDNYEDAKVVRKKILKPASQYFNAPEDELADGVLRNS